jgi:hypothetical protein
MKSLLHLDNSNKNTTNKRSNGRTTPRNFVLDTPENDLSSREPELLVISPKKNPSKLPQIIVPSVKPAADTVRTDIHAINENVAELQEQSVNIFDELKKTSFLLSILAMKINNIQATIDKLSNP